MTDLAPTLGTDSCVLNPKLEIPRKKMALNDDLALFAALVGGLGTDAPDDYPDWSFRSYESEREEVNELWRQIGPCLKKDLDKLPFISKKLSDAFLAFDGGDKEGGRNAMWDIYNLGIKKLR